MLLANNIRQRVGTWSARLEEDPKVLDSIFNQVYKGQRRPRIQHRTHPYLRYLVALPNPETGTKQGKAAKHER